MEILTRGTDEHPPDTTEPIEVHLAAAAALLVARRDATRRHDTAGHHIITAAWNAGMSERRIADLLELSRSPIRAELAKAAALGNLRRPLGSRSSEGVAK